RYEHPDDLESVRGRRVDRRAEDLPLVWPLLEEPVEDLLAVGDVPPWTVIVLEVVSIRELRERDGPRALFLSVIVVRKGVHTRGVIDDGRHAIVVVGLRVVERRRHRAHVEKVAERPIALSAGIEWTARTSLRVGDRNRLHEPRIAC